MAPTSNRRKLNTRVRARLQFWLAQARCDQPEYLQSKFGEDVGIEATHLNKILHGDMAVGPKVIARISKSVGADEAFQIIADYLHDEFDQIVAERQGIELKNKKGFGGEIEAQITIGPKR